MDATVGVVFSRIRLCNDTRVMAADLVKETRIGYGGRSVGAERKTIRLWIDEAFVLRATG